MAEYRPFGHLEGTLNESGPPKRRPSQAALDAMAQKLAPALYRKVRFDMYKKEKAARKRP